MIFPWSRLRRRCFHHDPHTGTSWVEDQLMDLGRCGDHPDAGSPVGGEVTKVGFLEIEPGDLIRVLIQENQRLRQALEVCDFVLHRAEPTDAQLHAAQQAACARWNVDWDPSLVTEDLPDWEWED